jgi:hypothetical protein
VSDLGGGTNSGRVELGGRGRRLGEESNLAGKSLAHSGREELGGARGRSYVGMGVGRRGGAQGDDRLAPPRACLREPLRGGTTGGVFATVTVHDRGW